MSQVGAVIEARLASQRLPRKVLQEVSPGVTMLDRVYHRVKLAHSLGSVRVVVPGGEWELFGWCQDRSIPAVMGAIRDVGNVMKELLVAAGSEPRLETIVEITADCPFIDPTVIDRVVEHHLSTNNHFTGFVDVSGFEVRVFPARALMVACAEIDGWQRDGSTIFYRQKRWEAEFVGAGWPQVPPGLPRKWSVDTAEELEFVRGIYRRLPWDAPAMDIFALVASDLITSAPSEASTSSPTPGPTTAENGSVPSPS